MLTKEKASKIFGWSLFVLTVGAFILSYLCGDHDYISFQTGVIIFSILFGFSLLAGILYLIKTDSEERKRMIFGLVLTILWFLYKKFFR